MELNMNRINEIFGNSMISEIKENKEEFIKNIEYVFSLGYKDTYELVELYPETFLIDSTIFKEKVNKLLDSLGVESFEILNENLELWGSLNE